MDKNTQYGQIVGYLQACADICSIKNSPVAFDFSFSRIGLSDDMLLSFKQYFINMWETDGYPDFYSGYDELVEEFNLHFIKICDWRKIISSSLDYWFNSLYKNDISYIKRTMLFLIDDFFNGINYEVYSFGEEDEEFIRHNFDYLNNEDYIFKTEKEIYLLHFGMND
ncbi:hypothetical protein [Anaeromicrobium sediminis]|uniref:Uncharacterized protein n=1 Tax=Anaeromicrobium sediminis TaxID=1478221 RepID=A0A267MB29_9FIRM|nr:hypothetical protein [Anaeromicrobium sediminis]PAB56000.1 hypothetical protein CCE28_21370 [Anaeromicrobium sediminis]